MPALQPTNGPRRYMSKSQRACDFCRSRRAACRIDKEPPCRQCSLHARVCTFNEDSAPRKTRRAEPKSAEIFPDNAPERLNLQDTNSHQALLTFDGDLGQLDQILSATGHNAPDSGFFLDENWTSADPEADELSASGPQLDVSVGVTADATMDENGLQDFFANIPMDLSPSHEPQALSDALVSYFIGETGEQDPNLVRRYRLSEHNEIWFKKLATRVTSKAISPAQWMLALPNPLPEMDSRSGSDSPSTLDERVNLETIVPPDVGDRLIKLFMRFIFPCFPIFSLDDLPRTDSSPNYLLAGIYLIADQFFSYDDYLCIQVVYDRDLQRRLFEFAWKSFSDNMHNTSISMVQTAIILLLNPPLDPLNPDLPFKWSLIGTLISMSETMGLHLDPQGWDIPEYQIVMRRRLSGVIYVLDTWFALSLGRPPRISTENWMLDQLEETDLKGADTQSNGFSFALEFSRLTKLVKLILQRLFTLKASATLTTDFRQVLETTRVLIADLSAWRTELPELIRFTRSKTLSTDIPRQRSPLHLAYFAARFSIIRALLRTFDNPDVESSLEEAEVDEYLKARQQCRDAALSCSMAVVDFMSALNGVDFEQFWPAWCSSVFAMIPHMSMLLVVTSRQPDEAGRCKFLLNKLRRVLRTQSRSFDTMRLASLRLDAHFWRGIDNTFVMEPQLGCSFDELIEVDWSAQPD